MATLTHQQTDASLYRFNDSLEYYHVVKGESGWNVVDSFTGEIVETRRSLDAAKDEARQYELHARYPGLV